MGWRRLVSGLTGRGAPALDEAFLDELIAVQQSFFPPADPGDYASLYRYSGENPIIKIRVAAIKGQPPPAEAVAWFETLRARLQTAYPDADGLALRWLLDVDERVRRVARATEHHWLKDKSFTSPVFTLQYWVEHHPAPGAADAVAAALFEQLRGLQADLEAVHPYHQDWQVKQAVEMWVEVLVALEAREPQPAFARSQAVLLAAVQLDRASQEEAARDGRRYPPVIAVPSTATHGAYTTQMSAFCELKRHIVDKMYTPVLRAGGLSVAELEEVVRNDPEPLYEEQNRRPNLSPAVQAKLTSIVDRYLARALAGSADAAVWPVLHSYRDYAGIDHFLAACRYIEAHLAAHPQQKLPISRPFYSGCDDPFTWAPFLLRGLAAPTADDWQRVGELATLKPATLLIAALYSPAWAALVERQLNWPGLATLAHWLRRHRDPGPWSSDSTPAAGAEDEDPGVVERAPVIEAAAAMGEARLRQILRHPLARSLYLEALYALQAVLGWNAAEVEAGFLKRNKRAVRALGMLPDEDDIRDRYLALRRFADEARQFGPQRQASERLAAESGLANLARTAGYDDLAQLEWAMEAQIGQEVDPSRTWTVGDYTVSLEASPAATVLVERGGKRLKSVPAAVRNDPTYAEIKAAREALAGQFERVRRRLEVAMTRAEIMTRRDFEPALTTPAGQALLPALVLRVWPAGAGEPIEVLDCRALDGSTVALDGLERFQIAHPLQLAASGSLAAWQRRLIEEGRVQPFNQLFREVYTPAPAERAASASDRCSGRQARLGTLIGRLRRHNWRRGGEGDLVRPCRGRLEVSLWFADGAAYLSSDEVLTLEGLNIFGPDAATFGQVDPIEYSEVMRELDLASAAATPNRTAAPVSPEVMAARAALVRAVAPAAVVEGETARLGGHSLHLGNGAVFGPDGAAVALPALSTPANFPYPDPDAGTAEVVARALYLWSR